MRGHNRQGSQDLSQHIVGMIDEARYEPPVSIGVVTQATSCVIDTSVENTDTTSIEWVCDRNIWLNPVPHPYRAKKGGGGPQRMNRRTDVMQEPWECQSFRSGSPTDDF
jgi:hypothetical protein